MTVFFVCVDTKVFVLVDYWSVSHLTEFSLNA